MRLGLWRTSTLPPLGRTTSVQQAAPFRLASILVLLHGDVRRAVEGIVAEAFGFQLHPGPLHHGWVAEKLQNQ